MMRKLKGKGVAFLMTAMLVILGAAGAFAAGVTLASSSTEPSAGVLISQTTDDSSLSIKELGCDGTGDDEKSQGQTFEHTTAFTLTAVTFVMDRNNDYTTETTPLMLALLEDTDADGDVDAQVGSTMSVVLGNMLGADKYRTLTLDTPVDMDANKQYAFNFAIDGNASAALNIFRIRTSNPGQYPNGKIVTPTFTAGSFPNLAVTFNTTRDLTFYIHGTEVSVVNEWRLF